MACLRMAVRLAGPSRFRSSATLTALQQLKVQPSELLWRCHPVICCSTSAPSNDITVQYRHGRPVLALPLPSRQEKCLFFLRPMLMTVSDLIHDIRREDSGVSSASVFTTDGVRVASGTPMDTLLNKDFHLRINGVVYNVHSVQREPLTSERVSSMEDVKNTVHMLHTALQLPEHHLMKEKELQQKLDILKQELMPLEQMKAQLDLRAERSSSRALWVGLALLSVQGGALAWLTWWVYSWDVMEPVTYFITYSTSIGIYAYYVLTKQDYVYPDAKDRQFLHYFYKGARRQQFSVQKYNRLKDELSLVEEDLRRLRNPNQLRLPVEQIQSSAE
ncbi:calcium uniporter regulatory subunit MCUb, mitochondrial [Pygocentrus nattereri]|uniref:Calcium uniporter regulatory subunit MCUb n=1 Tax=Pygocentrus nattereri TaxID=42514 RepID=A0A3B4CPP0_PYGNA|nr:calcium uniporter regulatory subunit MCUb, mitochondrial [Pygocentrus nattereri]